MKYVLLGILSTIFVTGCASGPVKPTYVSPTQYQSWNCAQLHSEYARLTQTLANGVEPEKRQGMGVGIGLGSVIGRGGGWGVIPSVSVNMGQSSNTQRTEIAKLFGQQDAIAQSANFKNCPITNPRQTTKS